MRRDHLLDHLVGMPNLMINKNTDLLSGLTACGRGLVAAGAFSLALNLLMLTVPLYMMSVYDRVLASRSEEALHMLSLVAVGALAAIGILDAVRQLVTWALACVWKRGLGSSPARITAEQPGRQTFRACVSLCRYATPFLHRWSALMMVLREGRVETFAPRDEVMHNQIRPAGQAVRAVRTPVPEGQVANGLGKARLPPADRFWFEDDDDGVA